LRIRRTPGILIWKLTKMSRLTVGGMKKIIRDR